MMLLNEDGVLLFPLHPFVQFVTAADVATQVILVGLVGSGARLHGSVEAELPEALRGAGHGDRGGRSKGAADSPSCELLLYGSHLLLLYRVAVVPSGRESLPFGKSHRVVVVVARSKMGGVSGVGGGGERSVASSLLLLLILLEGGVEAAVNNAAPTHGVAEGGHRHSHGQSKLVFGAGG